MKINQYGTPIVSSHMSKSEARKAASSNDGETGATIRISSEARQLGAVQARLSGSSEVREEKVAEARAALVDGSLDSDSALETALDRLMSDLF